MFLKQDTIHSEDKPHLIQRYKWWQVFTLPALLICGITAVILWFGNTSPHVLLFLETVLKQNITPQTMVLSVIALYVFCAFIALPQWLLHTISALSLTIYFDPISIIAILWGATLLSSSVGFALGVRLRIHIFLPRLRRYFLASPKYKKAIAKTQNILGTIRYYGFWSSILVRLVPTAPFALINILSGLSHMRFWAYLSGTAIGIIPKILLIVLPITLFSSTQNTNFIIYSLYISLILFILIGWSSAILVRQRKKAKQEKDINP